MSQSGRLSDYQILIGHLWQCHECREALLRDPKSLTAGLKLTSAQLDILEELTRSPHELLDRLHCCTGLDSDEFKAAIDHPRSRLRHLGARRDF